MSKNISKIKTKRKTDTRLTLESFVFPPYEEVMKEIVKKVGKKPAIPKKLPRGIWSKQAKRVLSERYLLKDKDGNVTETPEEMCWRVAWEIASAEARWGKTRSQVRKTAEEFYRLMVAREFLPNSPTLMNAGTGNMLQYSACFVLPVEDSMEGIFDALKYQALIHKSGGGTGFSFSRLRPRGSMVRSSHGTASGPVSFMRIFDAATNEVKQGGRRRGANMGMLGIDHPDVMEFIHCKEEGSITNFNISVAITDEFMEALEKDKDYDLIDPKTKQKTGTLSAKKVFDEIALGAWKTGDPGLVFIDRRNRGTSNPVPTFGPIEATNPCGEQELYPFDACNLGSIFLTHFVKENPSAGHSTLRDEPSGSDSKSSGGKKEVDWQKLKEVTRIAIRFLDDVIEVNPYPLIQIRQTVLAIRRIGLGVGGWADMLVELGIPYDSEEALKLATKVMKFIQDEAVVTSQELAEERGPFPLWPVSIYKRKKPRRNSTVTTIAPTGTISIIADASSGIEPLFAIAYQHIVRDRHLDRTLTFVNLKFEQIAKEKGFWSDDIKNKILSRGVIREINEVPEGVRKVFGTAHEIHHDWHIKMQAAFQRYTENAVSKTINMRREVGIKDVKDAYLLAWKANCKGITVFRDGCKEAQVLNLGVKNEQKVEGQESTHTRPFIVTGATYKLNTPVGSAFVTINQDEKGEPLELFINIGKAGSDVAAMAEALGRTISTALRFRSNLKPKDRAKEIAYQLSGIGGRRSVGFGPNKILSLPDAVAAALSLHFGFRVNGFAQQMVNGAVGTANGAVVNGEFAGAGAQSDSAGAVMLAKSPELNGTGIPLVGNNDLTTASAESNLTPTPIANGSPKVELKESLTLVTPKVSADICPSCGANSLVYEEGCVKCYSCGHSEC